IGPLDDRADTLTAVVENRAGNRTESATPERALVRIRAHEGVEDAAHVVGIDRKDSHVGTPQPRGVEVRQGLADLVLVASEHRLGGVVQINDLVARIAQHYARGDLVERLADARVLGREAALGLDLRTQLALHFIQGLQYLPGLVGPGTL